MWNDSWRAIYDRFGEAILAYARRGGLNEHSAHDVLQEVMTTLIRCQHGQAAGYNPAGGSFQGWLWTVIRNRVHSVRRKDRKEEAASPLAQTQFGKENEHRLPEIPLPPPDFERMEEAEWQRALLAAAMRKVQERVNPKNFAIYTALLEENAGPEELAVAHGMKANAIYALKHRCEEMLLCEARALRESWEQLRTTPTHA
jgi:RNA polymerase sigma factor (sigma-70 family)